MLIYNHQKHTHELSKRDRARSQNHFLALIVNQNLTRGGHVKVIEWIVAHIFALIINTSTSACCNIAAY